jgi:4-amino-4-deoxy-L-arabinose transferase-like glycosyltransferase
MVLVGLGLRVALILHFHYYDFSAQNSLYALSVHFPEAIRHFPFGYGYETGAIAYSLAQGRGFSSPFAGSTGPTAWLAPLYPSMCAVVFKIFGCFTEASAFLILSINSLFAALTCIPIVKIGEMTSGRKTGIWSGWIWACGISFMHGPTTWIWETSLSALLLSILFLQSLRLATNPNWKPWARFGLVWGVAALTNPALLSFLPASGIYAANRLRRNRQHWFRPAATSALVFALCISPWMVRNRAVFGKWIFIRGNAPFEFSLGNYHLSTGLGWLGKHPSMNKFEWAKYAQMGEVAYVAEKKKEGLAFVKQYPREFLGLCVVRFEAFWMGSPLTSDDWGHLSTYTPLSAFMLLGLIAVLAYRVEGAWLYFWLILCYPFVYYLVFAQPRYRHPIEPEMLLLSTNFVYLAFRDFAAHFRMEAKPQTLEPHLPGRLLEE